MALNDNIGDYDFEGVSEDSHICDICTMIIKQAVGIQCPHAFCYQCLMKWQDEPQAKSDDHFLCPTCKTPYHQNQMQRIQYLDRMILYKTPVKCKKNKDGCPWEGMIDDYYHVHEKECLCRLVTCNVCSKGIMFLEIKKHQKECYVKCPNAECEKLMMEVDEVSLHLQTECFYETIRCAYAPYGCQVMMKRGMLNEHHRNSWNDHLELFKKYHSNVHNRLTKEKEDTSERLTKEKEDVCQNLIETTGNLMTSTTKINEQTQTIEQLQQKLQQMATTLESCEQQKSELLESYEQQRTTLESCEQQQQTTMLESYGQQKATLLQSSMEEDNIQPQKTVAEDILHESKITEHLQQSCEPSTSDLSCSLSHQEQDILDNEYQKEMMKCFEELEDLLTSHKFKIFMALVKSQPDLAHLKNRKNNKTLLHMAAENGSNECVELLLECGCDPTEKDLNGWMAIHFAAAWNGYSHVVELLLLHDSSLINALTDKHSTPLHWAAYCSHFNTVTLLLKHPDVDVDVKDWLGRTPDECTEDSLIKYKIRCHRTKVCSIGPNECTIL